MPRKQIPFELIHSDGFTSMPATAQALYFHAAAVCDSDGFTSKLTTSKFYSRATDEDVELLISNGYIEPVESGGPNELSGYRLTPKKGR